MRLPARVGVVPGHRTGTPAMTARRHLTEAEAAGMTRREINERVSEEMEGWTARPPRTAAQRAAYDEMMRIYRAAIDLHAGLDSAFALFDGRPDGYWDARPFAAPEPAP
jgi:hypothetical protein